IRRRPQWQELPVIALTAQSRVEDAEASLVAGMSGHLTKPIIEEDLYDTIAGLLMAADNKPAPEAASVAEGGVECLPQTPTERLLAKFNGAEARLRRMGESFLRDFRTMPEDWDVVLAEGQAGEIADFVHRVKG